MLLVFLSVIVLALHSFLMGWIFWRFDFFLKHGNLARTLLCNRGNPATSDRSFTTPLQTLCPCNLLHTGIPCSPRLKGEGGWNVQKIVIVSSQPDKDNPLLVAMLNVLFPECEIQVTSSAAGSEYEGLQHDSVSYDAYSGVSETSVTGC